MSESMWLIFFQLFLEIINKINYTLELDLYVQINPVLITNNDETFLSLHSCSQMNFYKFH